MFLPVRRVWQNVRAIATRTVPIIQGRVPATRSTELASARQTLAAVVGDRWHPHRRIAVCRERELLLSKVQVLVPLRDVPKGMRLVEADPPEVCRVGRDFGV